MDTIEKPSEFTITSLEVLNTIYKKPRERVLSCPLTKSALDTSGVV